MGRINVSADNIFPIIKKFLYSDHEIFLRELVSNAVDATLKLKTLSRIGEAKGELGEVHIEIKLDKEARTLTVSDRGLGMTEDELNRYINDVAFSGAEEFVKQYKDKGGETGIIGHFGLGFYSAFMVARKVEIQTLSFREGAQPVHWVCEGSPDFEMGAGSRSERGTDIILHIDADNDEFLEEFRIRELLRKYCRFLPIPVHFGTREETISEGEGDEKTETKIEVPEVINNPNPIWTKSPGDLSPEDYKAFYRELYPYSFDEPLFHIHLHVDYPFDLNGVLYFPRLKREMELQKNKIQLYQNQVFVTDSVEGIVPDFLTLLHGVIDSRDIPLNVSRSYLQADGNVKKISGHITKKVADKLEELFKNDREAFEKNWDDTSVIVQYGMLSDEKFFEKAVKFYLLKDSEGKYRTLDELREATQAVQTDKDEQLVWLYSSDLHAQHAAVEGAKEKGCIVLNLDSPLSAHMNDRLERHLEKTRFVRVDSAPLDQLIRWTDERPLDLEAEKVDQIKAWVEALIDKVKFQVKLEALAEDSAPIQIHQPEFMRRMREMSKMGGGGMAMFGDFPESYELTVNASHELIRGLGEWSEEERNARLREALDLGMLSQNLLQGAELTAYVNRQLAKLKTEVKPA